MGMPRMGEAMNKDLTKSEKEIAELVAKEKSNKGIALELNKSPSSIRTCLKNIYSKLLIEDDEQINKRVILCLMVKMRDFAWIFEDIQRTRPWPVKGAQGLFNIPYEED